MHDQSTNSPTCPICEHEYAPHEMSKHHTVPKSRKGRETVLICRHCHKQIHALYTERELERLYGTLEKLIAAEQMQDWIVWIRKRKPTAQLQARMSRRKRRR